MSIIFICRHFSSIKPLEEKSYHECRKSADTILREYNISMPKMPL